MIFDMHCHTLEGSPDAVVGLNLTIQKLKSKGFNGMLVSDHNSYNGYKSLTVKPKNFTVLRGIEYDSLDGGHLLIILPSDITYEIFEYRGMRVKDVIKIVHALNGIVGPAHPYDYYKLGICNTKFKDDLDLLSQFDFIEIFNGCLNKRGFLLSRELANDLNKPCFGGSDSHEIGSVGLGYTDFKVDIFSENDLIRAVKLANYSSFIADGVFRFRKHDKLYSVGVVTGGFLYGTLNKCLSFNSKKKTSIITSALGLN